MSTGFIQCFLNVLSYKKPALWVTIVCVLVAAGVGVFLMTKPVAANSDNGFYETAQTTAAVSEVYAAKTNKPAENEKMIDAESMLEESSQPEQSIVQEPVVSDTENEVNDMSEAASEPESAAAEITDEEKDRLFRSFWLPDEQYKELLTSYLPDGVAVLEEYIHQLVKDESSADLHRIFNDYYTKHQILPSDKYTDRECLAIIESLAQIYKDYPGLTKEQYVDLLEIRRTETWSATHTLSRCCDCWKSR